MSYVIVAISYDRLKIDNHWRDSVYVDIVGRLWAAFRNNVALKNRSLHHNWRIGPLGQRWSSQNRYTEDQNDNSCPESPVLRSLISLVAQENRWLHHNWWIGLLGPSNSLQQRCTLMTVDHLFLELCCSSFTRATGLWTSTLIVFDFFIV